MRLPPVFPQKRRARLGGLGQWAALGLALVGHVSVAVAVMFTWTTPPAVSTGNPPQAIFAELVIPFSDAPEEQADLQSVDNIAADNLLAREGIVSATDAKDGVTASSPIKALPMLTGRDMALESLPKSASLTRPARSKKGPGQPVRLNAPTDAKSSIQSDSDLPDPTVGLASHTFGSNEVVNNISSTWKSKLLAHLERFKLYPEAAKSRHEEGTSLLNFTVDRNGRVLRLFISRSSGSNELDIAAQTMIERASPVPAIPDDVAGQSVQLVVPVRFTLRS